MFGVYHFSLVKLVLHTAFVSVGNLCKVRYIKLLISENQTLTLLLRHFTKL